MILGSVLLGLRLSNHLSILVTHDHCRAVISVVLTQSSLSQGNASVLFHYHITFQMLPCLISQSTTNFVKSVLVDV